MHTSQYTRAVFEGSLICRFKLSISSVSAQAASLRVRAVLSAIGLLELPITNQVKTLT